MRYNGCPTSAFFFFRFPAAPPACPCHPVPDGKWELSWSTSLWWKPPELQLPATGYRSHHEKFRADINKSAARKAGVTLSILPFSSYEGDCRQKKRRMLAVLVFKIIWVVLCRIRTKKKKILEKEEGRLDSWEGGREGIEEWVERKWPLNTLNEIFYWSSTSGASLNN